jgi:hypothetical protein
MQFNNNRDPNKESIWLKPDNNYNVEAPSDSCYSNLSHYGTEWGSNNYYNVNAEPTLGGGLVEKINMPYPVEPYPEIMQMLGKPHQYDSGYTGKVPLYNCNGYDKLGQYGVAMYYNLKNQLPPKDNDTRRMSQIHNTMHNIYSSVNWEEQARRLVEDFEKGTVKIYIDGKEVYNWIKRYICPNISLSVLELITKSVETVLNSSLNSWDKIARIAEIFFSNCV